MSTPSDSFVHLHLHTHYSLLDGLGRPDGYARRAKELGMPAIAVTDHGATYGLMDFYKSCRKEGVKPILGMEAYVARHGRHQKRPGVDTKPYHLILLAETNEGYHNLIELTTRAHLEGFYYKPRIDLELLEQYGSGLIALSACMNGEVPQKAMAGNDDEAIAAIQRYQKVFGENNFFLELQHHPSLPDQARANDALTALAEQTGAPLVATNDCHYVSPEDAAAHDILLCIQSGKDVHDPRRMRMDGADNYLKTAEEMRRAFAQRTEVCDQTLAIAERCNVEIELGRRLIPTYSTPQQEKPEDFFVELCYDGLKKRFGIPLPAELQHTDGTPQPDVGSQVVRQIEADLTPAEVSTTIERLEYELGIILDMGFANYFLIVWDFVKYAKESGVAVGPGRGSAAGALVSYCLGITNINPLEHGLLFERFLNPERVSMPDIDIDFADDRREDVLEYVSNKYGRDHVARVCTFGTMAAKAAVKDVGRTFGIPFADMNAFSALIPSRPGTSLADAKEQEVELREKITTEPYKQIWDVAEKIEGNIRQVGVHACAVIIADKPLTEYTALQEAPGSEKDMITQYNAGPLEDIGLLKMDFLGLRNLTIITNCLEIIRQTRGDDIQIDAIPMDDQATLDVFRQGATTGVFQFESAGMRRYLKELRPDRFEDLIAMASLYRPGPMENIPQYIKNKENPTKVTYPHPVLEEHLKDTYGIAVYQEQVQQIAQSFAGFSLGQGYMMIKAVGKKIPALMEEQRSLFSEGAIAKGHTKEEAERLFAIIEPFAGYGFNKSHSACYAYIAYQTGYLKAHYPSEFMAALMTADRGNPDRLTIDIEECMRMGIRVLPPSVNESLRDFTVVGDGDIRFGLSAIKGLGDGPIDAIIAARTSGTHFADMADYASRVPAMHVNKRTLEALTLSGALDMLGERGALMASIGDITDFAKSAENHATTNQASLFGAIDAAPAMDLHLARVPAMPQSERLRHERDLLGMYVSSHPLAGMRTLMQRQFGLIDRLTDTDVGKNVTISGIVSTARVLTTKKTGQKMAFLTLDDPSGSMEVSVFPKVFVDHGHAVEEGKVLAVTGRLDQRSAGLQLSAQSVTQIDLDKLRAKAETEGLLDDSLGYALPSEEDENTAESGGTIDAPARGGQGDAAPTSTSPEPYRIAVPAGTTPAQLAELKQLLVSHKSDTGMPVELAVIIAGGEEKIVPVPFAVDLNDTAHMAIAHILNHSAPAT